MYKNISIKPATGRSIFSPWNPALLAFNLALHVSRFTLHACLEHSLKIFIFHNSGESQIHQPVRAFLQFGNIKVNCL